MYPHTKFDIIDESSIPQYNPPEEYRPLFMYAITSDKGPENLRLVRKDFVKIFGDVSFTKHGQPLLQAWRTIDGGGEILVKRIVAPDSSLANIIIVAKTKREEVQKKNASGQLLYLLDGNEVTSADGGAEPIMVEAIRIKYEAHSVENASSDTQIHLAATSFAEVDENGFSTYPLFSIFDVGRGISNKKFRISPDYEGSKTINFLRYKFEVIEKNTLLESMLFSFDPEKIYLSMAFSLDTIVNKSSVQVKSKMYEGSIASFVGEMKEVTGIENILSEDILFGSKRTSEPIHTIIVDDASVNLTNVFGVSLANGANGSFGNAPYGTEAYETEVEKFFAGEVDDDIYDLVKYPVEAIIDANYPAKVKRAIESLVTFREDVMFFGDMGKVSIVEQMKNLMFISAKNKFCGYYNLSYDVLDPFTRKQINVTIGYSLARILPNHLKYGRNRPLSGIINSAIIDEAVEGTVNYTPKVTPKVNQKQELDDIRANYASWINTQLVLETQYTSQPEHTQLSYINNMLAMQEVIRAVRNRCPATRYSFIDGEDLETYQKDVQGVLNRYSDNFRELTFEYIQDDIMVQNKIFHAAIRVTFRNYVQAEYFKIYAIG